ncbi:hypothetical protein RJZ90_004034 [Blastomyces dermatitidis]
MFIREWDDACVWGNMVRRADSTSSGECPAGGEDRHNQRGSLIKGLMRNYYSQLRKAPTMAVLKAGSLSLRYLLIVHLVIPAPIARRHMALSSALVFIEETGPYGRITSGVG